tara:strand:- start:3328 stop:3513 length:186 start_codon:yes stop_codon:yes gene_type:complete
VILKELTTDGAAIFSSNVLLLNQRPHDDGPRGMTKFQSNAVVQPLLKHRAADEKFCVGYEP